MKTKGLVTGRALKEMFEELSPFDAELRLAPEKERRSILAANANYPLELQLSAFFHAAILDGGSPLIVQISGAGLEVLGGTLGEPLGEPSPSPSPSLSQKVRIGARLASQIAGVYADLYQPPMVALGLDHFEVPALDHALADDSDGFDGFGGEKADPSCMEKALSALGNAVDAARASGIDPPSREEEERYASYLCSRMYQESKIGFVAAVKEMNPAWAMIDTGDLPPILNFAVTKEAYEAVRAEGSEAIVEAEYGAIGQTGSSGAYKALSGPDLALFARQVAGFVSFTGASGIAYPIGMEHAALSGIRHEPDMGRLEAVQREILQTAGRYVPFAQHGGTGAARIAKGLVAKNNVNTHFLVQAARAFAAYTDAHRQDIAKGRKAQSGIRMYLEASRAIRDAVIEKIKDCGTYGFFRDN